jgi:hypothetical protein
MIQRLARHGAAPGRLADPELLREIAERCAALDTADPQLCDRFSLILRDLRIGGTWKRTNRGRLVKTEEILCAHLPPRLREDIVLLDLGASDGVTTVELVRALRAAFGGKVRAYLADRDLWLYRCRRGGLVEYRAGDGEPILARLGPFALRLARQRGNAPGTDRLARSYLALDRLRRRMRPDGRISLVNPLVKHEPGITAIRVDCLAREQSLVDRVSIVRASNILNRDYFTGAQIDQALAHVHAYLRPGGCLVVSRNHDEAGAEIEHGSLWSRTRSGFSRMADFGKGAEIGGRIDGWRVADYEPAR